MKVIAYEVDNLRLVYNTEDIDTFSNSVEPIEITQPGWTNKAYMAGTHSLHFIFKPGRRPWWEAKPDDL